MSYSECENLGKRERNKEWQKSWINGMKGDKAKSDKEGQEMKGNWKKKRRGRRKRKAMEEKTVINIVIEKRKERIS